MWFSWSNACDFHELMHAMWFSWILVVARSCCFIARSCCFIARSCCFIARSCCFRSCQTNKQKTTLGYLIHRYRTKNVGDNFVNNVQECQPFGVLAWIRMASLNFTQKTLAFNCFQLLSTSELQNWLMCCKQCTWTSCSCGVIWCGWCNRLHVI
jgi:hypothetical protein